MPKGSNYEIKTTIAIDGEKAFKAAMDDVNRSMRVTDADLKAMKAEFRATGDEEKYFTQRVEAMRDKMKQQEAVVEALTKAVKESGKMFGDAAAQTDGYRIKLSNATAKLFDMRVEAEEANRELEELGRDSNKIGRQIERGIGDAAEDTEQKVKSMFEGLQEEVNAIRSNTTVSAFMDIGQAIWGAAGNLDAFAESSREYRRSMSFLEQNAGLFGIEMGTVRDLFFEMASVTGEVDSSVEALSNLMAAGFNAEELAAAVDLLGGAVTRFPDTLKFESLADGLQETLATGEATGQYAELLERLGVDLEEFNKALSNAKTAEEDQQIALAYLTKNGLASAYQMYKDTNSELMAAEEATLRLNDAMAAFGEIIDKVTAPGKLFLAEVLSGFTTLATDGAEAAYGMSDEAFWTEMAKKSGGSFGKSDKWYRTDFGEAFKNIGEGLLDLIIPSAGAETLPGGDANEAGFQTMQEYVKGMQDAANAEVTAAQAAVATTIAQMNAEEQMQAAFTAGKNAMIEFGNGIAEGAGIPISNVKTMINQINAMLAGMASPAYGLGWGGITGGNIALYMDGQKVGGLVAGGVSRTIGRKVETKMTMK